MNRLPLGAVAVMFIIAATVGCSSPRNTVDDARSSVLEYAKEAREAGADKNAELLQDGNVTEDEYLEAAARYQTCMGAAGIDLVGPQFSPVDNKTLEWGYPEDITSSPTSLKEQETCRAQWEPVMWSFITTHEPLMDRPLMEAVQACLESQSLTFPSEAKSFNDLVGPTDDKGVQRIPAIEKCIISEALRLYPDLPGVTVAL